MNDNVPATDRLRRAGGALALLVVLCLLNRFAVSAYLDRLPATGFAEFTTARGVPAVSDAVESAPGEDILLLDICGLVERMEREV